MGLVVAVAVAVLLIQALVGVVSGPVGATLSLTLLVLVPAGPELEIPVVVLLLWCLACWVLIWRLLALMRQRKSSLLALRLGKGCCLCFYSSSLWVGAALRVALRARLHLAQANHVLGCEGVRSSSVRRGVLKIQIANVGTSCGIVLRRTTTRVSSMMLGGVGMLI